MTNPQTLHTTHASYASHTPQTSQTPQTPTPPVPKEAATTADRKALLAAPVAGAAVLRRDVLPRGRIAA